MYWSSAAATLGAAIVMAAFYTPTEPTLGPVQKISYLHVPVAINTFLACVVVFVANIGFIRQRGPVWDDLASAAAHVAVLFCTVVLLTGVIWARQAWNQWWTWSPLLTFSLVLWLLYSAYLVLHRCIGTSPRREMACAVYGAIAFLDVPLVYLSVKLIPDRHPSNVHLTPEMRNTLVFWLVPITMICAGLIVAKFRLNQRLRALQPEIRVEVRARFFKGATR